MIGLDTTFLIDFFKKDPKSKDILDQHDAVCVCEPVVFEFLCGNISEKAKETLREFLSQLDTFALDRKSAETAANIYRQGKQKGMSVGAFDALIAGTYQAHGVTQIATRNKKHFRGMERVEVISY